MIGDCKVLALDVLELPGQGKAEFDDKRFNTLYHYNNNNGFCNFRWMDNKAVMMVSTIHLEKR